MRLASDRDRRWPALALVTTVCAVLATLLVPGRAQALTPVPWAKPIPVGTTVTLEIPREIMFTVNGQWAPCLEHWVHDSHGTGVTEDLLGTPHSGRRHGDEDNPRGASHPWTQDDITRCAIAEAVCIEHFGDTPESYFAYQGYIWHVDAGDWGEQDDGTGGLYWSFDVNNIVYAAKADQIGRWVDAEMASGTWKGHAVRVKTGSDVQDVGVFWLDSKGRLTLSKSTVPTV